MGTTIDLNTDRLTVINHALVRHKLHLLRDKDTSIKLFRELVNELALLEAYEALRDLPLEEVEVETPLERTTCERLTGKKLVVIPILRAGLGMVDGVLELVPTARVGHLGMQRNPDTHEPEQYYCKLPNDIDKRVCLIVDPMLATGGSLIAAINFLREEGASDIRCLTLVSCPEGINNVLAADPDVQIFTCAVDRQLNERAYILPGLGDAGDRIYGTKG